MSKIAPILGAGLGSLIGLSADKDNQIRNALLGGILGSMAGFGVKKLFAKNPTKNILDKEIDKYKIENQINKYKTIELKKN